MSEERQDSTVPRGTLLCPFCKRLVHYDASRPIIENLARVSDLEGALDDAMAEIRDLRKWRERARDLMREMGLEARELMRALDLEPQSKC